ncbi:MAG: hypothetical protein NC548_10975 [Lachnospiraceae bacterium]|nr:hypothetical protein [Lachnospiraceae bacterium]MCM1233818.1 hypothetical protein [Ruminococcus flavefaciens]
MKKHYALVICLFVISAAALVYAIILLNTSSKQKYEIKADVDAEYTDAEVTTPTTSTVANDASDTIETTDRGNVPEPFIEVDGNQVFSEEYAQYVHTHPLSEIPEAQEFLDMQLDSEVYTYPFIDDYDDPVIQTSLRQQAEEFISALTEIGYSFTVDDVYIRVAQDCDTFYDITLCIKDQDISYPYWVDKETTEITYNEYPNNFFGSDYCRVWFVNGLPDNAEVIYDTLYDNAYFGDIKSEYTDGSVFQYTDMITGETFSVQLQ